MSTQKITDNNFDEVIKNSKTLVLVDFWAEWCGPCKQIGPILEEISEAKPDKLNIFKLNVDENPQTPSKYGVKGIPTLMIFNNGHEDCRKLTPEVVNNESGKYLHQFEWTNQISKIPHNKICTEGYDTIEKSHHAVHYTRGGPWIKDMDCSNINMLDLYYKHKNSLYKKKVY